MTVGSGAVGGVRTMLGDRVLRSAITRVKWQLDIARPNRLLGALQMDGGSALPIDFYYLEILSDCSSSEVALLGCRLGLYE